ncbi:hypothetical protein VCHA51O444_10163 [Vibrio chagasii]|nr:hypothetical protein VCHA51O444_10163 [Vibrio chagasii]CAH7234287.1 hypothetical protein VCHA53O474_250062 [Vibrio chagasii]
MREWILLIFEQFSIFILVIHLVEIHLLLVAFPQEQQYITTFTLCMQA